MTRQGKRIVRFLLRNDLEIGFSARDMSKHLRMPLGTVRRELPSLVRDLLIQVVIRGGNPQCYAVTSRAYQVRL